MAVNANKVTASGQKSSWSCSQLLQWSWLAVSTLLWLFCLTMVLPVFFSVQEDILKRITDCESGKPDSVSCSAQAAEYYGLATSLQALGNLCVAAPYAAAADRFGRKPFLCLSILSTVLPFTFLLGTPSTLTPLYVSCAASGLVPQPLTMLQIMTADVAPAGRRFKQYGTCGAAFSIFVASSAILGSVIVPAIGRQWVLKAIITSTIWLLMMMALLLPESRKAQKEVQRQLRVKHVVPATSVARILLAGTDADMVARWQRSFYWLYILSALPEVCLVSILFFFLKDQYGFALAQLSLVIAVAFLGMCFWQTLGVNALKKLCPNEGRIFQAVIGVNLCHLMPYIFMHAHWAPFISASMAGSVVLQTAVLRAMITDLTDKDSLGRVNGILYSCTGICQVIGPGFCGSIYASGSWLGLPQLPWCILAFGLLPLSCGIASFTLLPASMPLSLRAKAAETQGLLTTKQPFLVHESDEGGPGHYH